MDFSEIEKLALEKAKESRSEAFPKMSEEVGQQIDKIVVACVCLAVIGIERWQSKKKSK